MRHLGAKVRAAHPSRAHLSYTRTMIGRPAPHGASRLGGALRFVLAVAIVAGLAFALWPRISRAVLGDVAGGDTSRAPSGADPELQATVYDPYAGELLRPYGELRAALAAGDQEALERLANASDGYSAYLAASELASWESLPPGERLLALERALELRLEDSLRRAENRELQLLRGHLARAAGEVQTALDAYDEALPLREAREALAELQTDPYRLAATYQRSGLHSAALEALGPLTAPSIEAPSLRALGRYEEALDAYRRWSQEVPGDPDAALGAAWCLFYLGRDAEATAAFSELGSAGYYGLGLLANRAGDIDGAIDLLGRTGRADVLWLATGILEARDRFTDSLPLYLELARGGSSYADDSAYRAYVLASRLGLDAVANEARSLLPEGNFFAMRLGSPSLAPDPAEVAVAQDGGAPNASAVTAGGAEEDSGTEALAAAPPSGELLALEATAETPAASGPPTTAQALELASALYGVHEEEAAVGELLFALRRAEAGGSVQEVLALGEMLQSMDEYRHSVSAARSLISSGVQDLRAWRLAYPPAWPDLVIGAAEEEGVEPGLIWAVMRQESAFSEVAVSVANAQGLMQVIPSTWDWIAELRKEEPGDPFDVAANVAYGTTYLAWLMNYFDGDLELVIASYNGGQGYVRRLFESDWVREDKDDFYREIDRSETREYLQRVYENLAVYRTLYPSIAEIERQHGVLAMIDASDLE